MTSQGDRDALIDAMAGYELDEGYSLSDAQAADLLDALLALPDTLLRVLLEARKPCERCEGGGWFGSTALDGKGAGLQEMTPCPTCHGSGSVPLVDRAQVLAALGMEQVGWRGDGVEFTTRPNVANARRMWAEPVPVPDPSEGEKNR